MNIAIFGASFDPPHIGHEQIVQIAIKNLKIDNLFVVPTFLNPFKSKSFLDTYIRYDLAKKVFENTEKTEVIDFEIKQNKPTATIYTVEYLIEKYKPNKIYVIIGADNLKRLNDWAEFDKLNSLVEFVLITRDGYQIEKNSKKYKILGVNIDISSSQLRAKMDLSYIPNKIKTRIVKLWKKE
jgi:nicotinate-nucleotide adenylyltransferase